MEIASDSRDRILFIHQGSIFPRFVIQEGHIGRSGVECCPHAGSAQSGKGCIFRMPGVIFLRKFPKQRETGIRYGFTIACTG